MIRSVRSNLRDVAILSLRVEFMFPRQSQAGAIRQLAGARGRFTGEVS